VIHFRQFAHPVLLPTFYFLISPSPFYFLSMCGIAAIFGYGADAPPVDREELITIRDNMAQRGPDGVGEWISEDRRIGIAHRRLAIIDLSEAGAEPMWNAERTLCITFNGEIYNYRALRARLIDRGYQFVSHSDTEVLLHLYAEKGAEMVHELRGMYAFVLWDAKERSLFLARDPFGIKPIYYADDGRTLRVASQVKALLAGRHVDTTPEPAGHVAFFLWGSVPDPFTFYQGVCGLPAGHTLKIRAGERPQVRSFCSIPEILRDAESEGRGRRSEASPQKSEVRGQRTDSAGERRELLHAALRDSAEHHLVADVPVGIFLSAGLDSSTITALVSESHPDVRTVTLGFKEYRGSGQDETVLAETVARRYGTNHQTIWITRRDFEAEATNIFKVMDRPSIDGINTYFVSLAAKRTGLKVALSGLGGDELFGGYPSFQDVPRIVRTTNSFRPLRSLGRAIRVVSSKTIARFTSPKYAGIFEYGSSYPGAYLLRRGLFMPWELPGLLEPDLVEEGWRRLNTMGQLSALCDSLQSERLKVSALELSWYMRHQLLRDADWAGMGHSLEIRVPMVDVKLLREIAPLLASPDPPGKQDMALSARTPLPQAVLSRPKTGFTVPVRDWLLRSFDPQSARERGLRGWAREVYSRFASPLAMHALTMRSHGRRRARNGIHSKAGIREPAVHSGQNLRVLMLLTDGFGGFGGIAKFNRDFLTALCNHARTSEVVAVPRLMPHYPGVLPEKLELVREGLGSKRSFVAAVVRKAMELRRNISAEESIAIFCGHINYLALAVALRRICGGSVHLIIHGIDAWKPSREPLLKTALRKLDGFIAVSHVTKERFQSWSRLRFDQGVILPNCVNLDAFTPGMPSADLIERYGLEGRKVLMTLGRLASAERYKGFDEIIELLPRLAEEFPGIVYLVCGDGADRPRLVAKARLFDCEVFDVAADPPSKLDSSHGTASRPRVVFTGRVDESEKADHYRLADLYVMPSSGEGFGIVYLEALACGVPVVGSKADGSREALREGTLGILVDPRDPDEIYEAIIHALNSSSTAQPKVQLADLEYFSEGRFELRVHEIVETIAPRFFEGQNSSAQVSRN
jgi:asparagine synthase (glutamine-hydrolysing)